MDADELMTRERRHAWCVTRALLAMQAEMPGVLTMREMARLAEAAVCVVLQLEDDAKRPATYAPPF